MKKPGVFTIALAAIFYATSLSLHWPSDEMPSLSIDGVNAQNRVGVNTRLTRPPPSTEPFPGIPVTHTSTAPTEIRT